jgi:hypothetical protein
MSVWDWIHEFAERVEAEGDEERLRLWDLQQQAFLHGKSNPESMLAALEEGRSLAQLLQEPWWVLHFDHWRLQCYMHYLLDYTPVLDIAVRAALEARKPAYAQLPQRICLHEDLIYGYLGVDPLGHAPAIEKALDFMAQEVCDELECRYCLQNCRSEFALLRGQLDEAEQSARITLDMADADPVASTGDHHAVYAFSDLCAIALKRRDWETLRDCSEAGEAVARREEEHLKLAEFLLFEALLARRDGNEDLAGRLYRQARTREKRVKSHPGYPYYEVLSAFHESAGAFDKALEARGHELAQLNGKGRPHDECRCRVQRCRLLALLGEPLGEELSAARAAATRLRDPSPHLEVLDRIERGDVM